MSILDKLRKSSTIKESDVLSDSKFFNKKDMVQTDIPMLNVALSGSLDGGITPGLTLWCGPSKHFKSFFCLLEVKAYMNKYPEAVCLFYDSEFGAGKKYFESMGIDTTRVIHTPILDIEQLKFDLVNQLDNIARGDKVIIMLDSLGNLASKKEADDALAGKNAQDMSRAKQIKSLFRIVTPHLTIKDIPMVVVNHIYMEMGLYPKAIVSGGCLVEDTKIMMGDFSTKNIQDIVVGEFVHTLSGPQRVNYVWDKTTLENGTPECYEIEFEDGHIITCSDSHEFNINNTWVCADNLKIGDEVLSVQK